MANTHAILIPQQGLHYSLVIDSRNRRFVADGCNIIVKHHNFVFIEEVEPLHRQTLGKPQRNITVSMKNTADGSKGLNAVFLPAHLAKPAEKALQTGADMGGAGAGVKPFDTDDIFCSQTAPHIIAVSFENPLQPVSHLFLSR